MDLTVAELALNLIGGGDLTTRRPYPNKHYRVGCRKIGQKAVSGLLIKAEGHVPHYTVTTRWAVGAERIVSHVVRYRVLDDDFDCVTDEMTTWYASATPRLAELLAGTGCPTQGAVRCRTTNGPEGRLPQYQRLSTGA